MALVPMFRSTGPGFPLSSSATDCPAGQRSWLIQRTGCPGTGASHYMEINHGGGDILVSHEVLHHSDVDSRLKQVGGKGMSQRMRRSALVDSSLANGDAQLASHGIVVEVVARDFACARMGAK